MLEVCRWDTIGSDGLLKSAMRKLGAKTQAPLVEKMQGMPKMTADKDAN